METPADDPYQANRLSDLANMLRTKFEYRHQQTMDPADLGKAQKQLSEKAILSQALLSSLTHVLSLVPPWIV